MSKVDIDIGINNHKYWYRVIDNEFDELPQVIIRCIDSNDAHSSAPPHTITCVATSIVGPSA